MVGRCTIQGGTTTPTTLSSDLHQLLPKGGAIWPGLNSDCDNRVYFNFTSSESQSRLAGGH